MTRNAAVHIPVQLTYAERQIIETLRAMKFGSVEITVHDAKVVQAEVKEKFRFQ
jgi:hypothetical protein